MDFLNQRMRNYCIQVIRSRWIELGADVCVVPVVDSSAISADGSRCSVSESISEPTPKERVSEVDLMSATYSLSVHRRIEAQWTERINSLRQIHGQNVVGTERTLQRVFNNDDSLIPVPVRAIVDRRQLDQSRPRD